MLGLRCCGNRTHVIETREPKNGLYTRRQRRCLTCDRKFTTKEYVADEDALESREALIDSDNQAIAIALLLVEQEMQEIDRSAEWYTELKEARERLRKLLRRKK